MSLENTFVQGWSLDDGYLVRNVCGDLLQISIEGGPASLDFCPVCPPTIALPTSKIPIPDGTTQLIVNVANKLLSPPDQEKLVNHTKRQLSGHSSLKGCSVMVSHADLDSIFAAIEYQNTLVVQVLFSPDFPRLQQAEKQALSYGAAFCAVVIRFPQLFVGPCSDRDHSGLYEQFYKRLVSASLTPFLTHVSLQKPVLDGFAIQLDECIKIINRIEFGDPASAFLWSTLNLLTGQRHNRHFIPWIDWPGYLGSSNLPRLSSQALVDPEVGIITQLRRIKHDQTLPLCVTTVQSDVTDIRVISQWANNSVCQGSSINDWPDASNAAIGEGIERYCINILDLDRIIVGSWKSLSKKNISACDPSEFILFSDGQYSQKGFAFAKFTEDTSVPWINGVRLGSGEIVYVPSSMVYVNYNHSGSIEGVPISSYPNINPVPYAGVAAGFDGYDPVVNGLEEIIERDATMIWWHSMPCIDPVRISTPDIDDIKEEFGAAGFELKFLVLPNEFQIPVVAACLTNKIYDTCNIGFSCRPNIEEAAKKAITEAATLFEGAIDLLNQNGRMYQAIRKQELSEKMALPWRQDRLYLDSINWDFSRVKDLMIQQHINLDLRSARFRDGHLDRPERDIDTSWIEQSPQRNANYYLDRLWANGYEAISVDVTTPDVRMCGGEVVRVLVPGLVPNFAAGHITLGRSRIQNAYFDLGILDRPQTPANLNYFPLPHA